MTGLIVLAAFGLLFLIIMIGFLSRADGGAAPISTKTLREIERDLLEIQNNTTDIYAKGKASHTADKIRKVLDRD